MGSNCVGGEVRWGDMGWGRCGVGGDVRWGDMGWERCGRVKSCCGRGVVGLCCDMERCSGVIWRCGRGMEGSNSAVGEV